MDNKELADKQCFECGKSPSDWASINNGIFLCLKCSADHRDFGANVSFIKSLTLDVWNDNMFKFMQLGGNFRLRQFLNQAGVPSTLDKRQLYSSKLMGYYRRLLKSQVTNSAFYEQFPPENEYWNQDKQGQDVDNIYMSKIQPNNLLPFQSQNPQIRPPMYPFPQPPLLSQSQSQFNQGGFGGGFPQPMPQSIGKRDPNFPSAPPDEFPMPQQQLPKPNTVPQYPSFGNQYSKYPPDEYTNEEEGYKSNNQFNPYSNHQPNIPQQQQQPNQYQQPNQPNQQGKGFEVINNAYSNNPNQNANMNKGNDIYSQYNRLYNETGTTQQHSIGTNVSNFFTRVWDKTKETTANIKDKYNDSKFGQTMNMAGHKTVEGMKVAGTKIAETGTKVAHSQAMQTVKEKTTNSYTFVKDKITGNSNQPPQNNYNYY